MDKLTYREIEIINYTAYGLTAKEIAREIGLEHRTVEIYMQNLRKKLGAKNAAHAIYLYFCKIIAQPPHPSSGAARHLLPQGEKVGKYSFTNY